MTTPLEEAVELKPCPFCGCSLERVAYDEWRPFVPGDPTHRHPRGDCILSGSEYGRHKSFAAAWNTRINALSIDEERVASMRNTIILILDANYHTAISKAQSTADQIIQSIVGEGLRD